MKKQKRQINNGKQVWYRFLSRSKPPTSSHTERQSFTGELYQSVANWDYMGEEKDCLDFPRSCQETDQIFVSVIFLLPSNRSAL